MSFPIQKSAIDNIEHDLSHQYAELKIRIQAEQSNSSNGRFRLVALISTLLQRMTGVRPLVQGFLSNGLDFGGWRSGSVGARDAHSRGLPGVPGLCSVAAGWSR